MSGQPTDISHDDWSALAVGHALDSLEPEDEQSFLRHLSGCALCPGVLTDTWAVMGNLAYALDQAEPPPALAGRIRAGIADTARPRQQVTALPQRRRRSLAPLGSRPWLAVAAGLVLVMSLTVWNVVLQVRDRSQERQLAHAALLSKCLQDVGCRTVELRTPNSDQPRATALVRAGETQLLATGLPRNDTRAEIYVLWQGSDKAHLTALTSFDITRPGVTVIRSSGSARPTRGVLAVSREPGRSTPPIPGEVVAIGTLSG